MINEPYYRASGPQSSLAAP